MAEPEMVTTGESSSLGEGPASDVVLLVGAGSSCQLGLPTLDDLLRRAVFGEDEVADRIRRTRDSIQASPLRYHKAVFEELIVKIKDYIRISEVLRCDYNFRKEMGSVPHDADTGALEWKWKEALTRCYRILLTEYGPERINPASKEFKVTVELFKRLADLNGGSLHIYTTNYDCSFQVLAANCRDLSFASHIDSTNGKFAQGSWYSCNEQAVNRVFVHRLHGCIGWFNVADDVQPDAGSIIEEVYGSGGPPHLEIKDDARLHQMCIKLIASQLIGTNPAFASAFDEFCGHLKTARALLIWGYSFRDLEVVRVINHAFSERSTPLQIFYVDPFLTEDAARSQIRRTLLNAPIQASIQFRPAKIDWTPGDGLDAMVEKTISVLKPLKGGAA